MTIQTYVPLYRKYRPQAFADVVGQGPIMQTLGNAITLNKVAHAYLFCGPRGTGKTSTARIFAKSLNCEQGPTLTPCQTCASCAGITQGNAIDVIEFDAASNNKVDDARELIENCQFTPMAGKYKVYIIDEVHMLTTQAFNALLKTLEEPPPNVVFVFATTEAHKVLPTIISRCQRFDFNRITRGDIVARLAWIAEQEQIQIDTEALDTIARHVRGGMRDAVGLLDQVAVLGRGEAAKRISAEDVARFIGALEEDILVWIAQAIAQRQSDILLQQVGELEKRGIEPAQIVKELSQHFRNLLLVATCGQGGQTALSAGQLDLPESYFQKLTEQTAAFTLEELPQILSRLAQLERTVRNTQQPQLWLEVGLLELAYREDMLLVRQLSERVAQLEAQLAGGGGGSSFNATAQTAAPARATRPAAAAPAPVSPRPARPAPTAPINPPAAAVETPPATTSVPATAASPRPAEAAVSQAAPPEAATVAPAASAASLASDGSLSATYSRVCQQVASTVTRDLLIQQTFAVSFEGGALTIGCPSEGILTLIKKPNKLIHVQKAVEAVLGEGIAIQFILQKDRPAEAAAPQQPSPPAVTPAEPASSPSAAKLPAADPAPPQAGAMATEEAAPAPPSETALLPETASEPAAEALDESASEGLDEPVESVKPMVAGGVAAAQATATVDASGFDPELNIEAHALSEAKQFTVELLQGKVLD